MCIFCHYTLYPFHDEFCNILEEKIRREAVPLIWKYKELQESLHLEKERLKTFIEWPYPPECPSPVELAKNGFFYTRVDDVIKCIYCETELQQLHLQIIFHRTDCCQNPNIMFQQSEILDKLQKPPLKEGESIFRKKYPYSFPRNISQRIGVDYPLTVVKTRAADAIVRAYAEREFNRPVSDEVSLSDVQIELYTSTEERIESFPNNSHNPLGRIGISRKRFAEAGFRYAGISDHVQCFCCGMIIRNWYYNDPGLVHAKLNPECQYVKLRLFWYNREKTPKINIISDFHLSLLYENPTSVHDNVFAYTDDDDPMNILARHILRRKVEETGFIYFGKSFIEDRNLFLFNNDLLQNYNFYRDNRRQLSLDYNSDKNYYPGVKCVICFMNPPNICLWPCKHFSVCADCALILKLSNDPCPMCKMAIKEFIGLEYTRCRHCQNNKAGIFALLPCRCTSLCRQCAFNTFKVNKYPIKCPTCQWESEKSIKLFVI